MCDHPKKYQHPWARIFRVRLRNRNESRLTHPVGHEKGILDAKDAFRILAHYNFKKGFPCCVSKDMKNDQVPLGVLWLRLSWRNSNP